MARTPSVFARHGYQAILSYGGDRESADHGDCGLRPCLLPRALALARRPWPGRLGPGRLFRADPARAVGARAGRRRQDTGSGGRSPGGVRGAHHAPAGPAADHRDRRRLLHRRDGPGQPAAFVGGRAGPAAALERRHRRGARGRLRQRRRRPARPDDAHAERTGAAHPRPVGGDRAGRPRRRRRAAGAGGGRGTRDAWPDPDGGARRAGRVAHRLRPPAWRHASAAADRPGHRDHGHGGRPEGHHHGPARRPVEVPARGRRPWPAPHRGRGRVDRGQGARHPARVRGPSRPVDQRDPAGHLRRLGRRAAGRGHVGISPAPRARPGRP